MGYQTVSCRDCGGTGKARCMGCTSGWVPMGSMLAPCGTCGGTRYFKCLTCRGTGKRSEYVPD